MRKNTPLPRPATSDPEFIGVIDADGLVTYATPEFREFFGLKERQDFRKLQTRKIAALDRHLLIESLDSALSHPGDPTSIEISTDDDLRSRITVRFSPEVDKKGKATSVLCTVRQCGSSDTNQDLDQLQYIAKLVSFTEDPLFSTDPDFIIRSWNEGAEKLYGLKSVDVIGKRMSELFPDMEFVGSTIEESVDKMKMDGHWAGDCRFHLPSGEWIHASVTVNRILSPEGRDLGFVSIHRDVTRKKIEEERMRFLASIMDNTTDAISTTDNDLLITSWNKGCEARYGVSESDAKGRQFKDILKSAEFLGTTRLKMVAELRKDGRWHGECRIVTKAGTNLEVLVNINTVYDDHMQAIGFVSIHRDITRSKTRDIQERNLTRMLQFTDDAIIALDPESRVVSFNKGAEKLYTVKDKDAQGKLLVDLIGKAEYPPWDVGEFARTLAEKGHWDGEFKQYLPDGGHRVIQAIVSDVKDGNGKMVGYMAIHHQAPMTEQEHFRRSFLHSLMEMSDDAIYVSGLDQHIMAWNKTCVRLYGVEAKDAIGSRIIDIVQSFVPVHGTLESAIAELNANRKWSGECTLVTRSGRKLQIHNNISPIFDERGLQYGYVALHRNITELRQADWATASRTVLVDQTSDAVLSTDMDMVITTWNKGAEVMYGVKEADAIGKRLAEIVGPFEFVGTTVEKAAETLRAQGEWCGDMIVHHFSGKKIVVNLKSSQLKDKAGACLGFLGIHRNISREWAAETQARYLNGVLAQTSDAIFTLDLGFHVTSWNHGAELLYSCKSGDAIGRDIKDVLDKALYPDMSSKSIRSTLHEKGQWIGELIWTTPEEKTLYIKSSVSLVLDRNGQPVGYMGIHHNVTALREKEQDFRHLARLTEFTDDAVFSTDTKFQFLSWNKGAEMLYGLTFEQVRGKSLFEVLPKRDYIGYMEEEPRLKLFEKGNFKGEAKVTMPDGRVFWVLATANKLLDEQGVHIGYVSIHRDITKERQNADQNEYLNRLLQNTNEAVISLDQQFRVIGWNHGASVIYGKSEQDSLGLTLSQVLPDVQYPKAGPMKIRQALVNDGQWEGDMIYPKTDGTLLHIHVNSSRVTDKKGEFLGYVAVHRDVTRQKEIESRNDHLTRMLHYTKDGIVSVDTDFKIRFWNKAAEKLLGKSEQEALGLTMRELMGDAKFEDQRLMKMREELLSNGFFEGDIHYDEFDGRPMHLHMDIRKVSSFDGTMLGFIAMYRDITDVWQKDRESVLDRQMLETIFNSTLEGMSIMDPQGIVLRINDKGLELSGTTRDQRIGKPLWANTFWEHDPEELERLQLALEDARHGKITSYTLKFQLENGIHRHVAISIKPTLDDQGNIVYISSEAKDISDQAEAEENMRYNAELLNSFQENTPLPSWLMNEKDEIVYMNPIFRELFGLKPEDAGRKMKDLLPSRFLRQYQTHNDIVRNTGHSLQTLEHAVDTEGMLHTFLVTRFPIRILGRPLLIGAKGVDITELLKAQEEVKETNKRFESVGEATNDLIWEMDLATMTITEFGNSEILWGSRKNMSHNFDEFLEIIEPKDRDTLLKGFEKALQNRFKDRWNGEFRVLHSDGSVRHVLDRAIILRTPDGQPFKVVGTIQDITDRVRLEKELIEQHNEEHKRTTRKIFEAEEKERTRIAGDLHDNVNPLLAAAKMHISIAESHMEDPTPYLLQSKSLIYEGIEEIRKISRNLSTNFIKEMTIEEAVDSTVQKLNPGDELQIHTSYRKLEKLHPDPPFKMNIIRIVQEQVHNTLKYAAAKNLYIELSGRESKLRLVIKDDGKGYDTKLTRPGIGLSNIRSRVESYSGQIKISSGPGKGTKMEIEIPVKEI